MRERYEKAQAFLANLAEKSPDLPFEPSLLPELFAATSETSVRDMAYISTLVERSQGLASRILRLANSAYYGMQTEVSSLAHAVRLLGLNEVRNIILQLGVSSAVSRIPLPKGFPFEKLWEHQLFTANIARGLAKAMPVAQNAISADDMYAAGLLHDMGKTMLAAYCPSDWIAINDLATCENIPFHQAEENYWGLDHAVVGARLLTFWGIPAKLTELVNWHHVPHQAKPAYQAPARILTASNLLAHNLDAAGSADALDVDEAVTSVLPKELDPEKVQESIIANCDVDRVRSMAKTSLED
ncbi:MAG: HDOD domain-containing protein [Deltaproteobacteria bacterium]|nr:HDOD domain-containing protein [Deltaproteobacteria bacterium]